MKDKSMGTSVPQKLEPEDKKQPSMTSKEIDKALDAARGQTDAKMAEAERHRKMHGG